MVFEPPLSITVAFVALTLGLVGAEIWLVRRVAPEGSARRWTARAVAVAVVWLGLHAGIARSGILVGDELPPPLMIYLVATQLVAVAVAMSPLGRRLAALPLGLLVGLQAFRLPLETILHALYEAGSLPIQMTWSGWNFDVITGATAAGLGLAALRRPLPARLVGAWNVMGAALLLVVVSVAVTSAPTPLRRFTEGPPLLLPFDVPFNWIVNVHVWTAVVGHIVIFRGLAARARADAGA